MTKNFHKEKLSLYIMCLLYVIAGIFHFIIPEFYNKAIPTYLPAHAFLTYLSGLCEIVFGIMLLKDAIRKIAAYLIIAMLLVFMIVHVQMLADFLMDETKPLWLAILRIPLQFVLIAWAFSFTKTVASKDPTA
jgi:uncharacterized membrane protein